MRSNQLFSVVSLTALVGSMAACVIENDGPHRYRNQPAESSTVVVVNSSSSSSGSTAPPVATGTKTSTAPMLVEIDSGQTMNAQPGEGFGVFVEYVKGGHWHVWFTCDTNQTGQSCNFAVTVGAATGNISNIDANDLAGGLYSSPTPSTLEARATTTTDVKGIYFDTDPGAVITIEGAFDGMADPTDGSFFFFVQDGKVNGGFAGVLTNPLRIQGTVP